MNIFCWLVNMDMRWYEIESQNLSITKTGGNDGEDDVHPLGIGVPVNLDSIETQVKDLGRRTEGVFNFCSGKQSGMDEVFETCHGWNCWTYSKASTMGWICEHNQNHFVSLICQGFMDMQKFSIVFRPIDKPKKVLINWFRWKQQSHSTLVLSKAGKFMVSCRNVCEWVCPSGRLLY